MLRNKITINGIAIVIAALMVMITIPAYAQHHGGGNGGSNGGGNGGGGCNNGNIYFNPDTVKTFSGTLISGSDDWTPWGNGNHTGDGMHFRLQTNAGAIYELMLGNYYYMLDQGLQLNVGDTVTVTGSVVDPYRPGFDDYEYIIASEINGVKLRDDNGYPLWGGNYGGGRGGGGNGQGNNYWDPDTVNTYNGTLTENLGLWMSNGHGNHTGNSMHYIFASNSGVELYAMFGPYWFLEDSGIELEEGLTLKITGSVVEPYFADYDDHDYIIVSEVTVNGKTVKLRDENGYPLWGGTGGHYYSPAVSTASDTAISGTVTSVRTRTNGANLDDGYELKIRTENRKHYRVFVAPEYYTEHLGFSVKRGQSVKINGFVKGKDIVVRTIRDGQHNYTMRDRNGTPCWQVGGTN